MTIFKETKLKNSSNALINPATAEGQAASDQLVQTLQELVSRLDTLSACKYHLAEALRVQVIGSAAITAYNYDSTSANYSSPPLVRFISQMAMGNTAAILGNINNVSIS